MMSRTFNEELQAYASSLEDGFSAIDDDRRQTLAGLADYIRKSVSGEGQSNLLFVCTHNSRRSQFAQVWLHTASIYYDVENVDTYSGGTETTAANERTVKAMERAGFSVTSTPESDGNHLYEVKAGRDMDPNLLFSKVYSDKNNPQEAFAAVMVCSDADEACPVVHGAEKRISLPFNDPKTYDGTPEEAEQYDHTCRLIATEMFYVMHLVKNG